MGTLWVLVCDSAKARFFEVGEGESRWRLVSEAFHAGSRSKAADLVSDRSGTRSSEGASVHHNALAPASLPKEVQKQHFAHELGKTLDRALRSFPASPLGARRATPLRGIDRTRAHSGAQGAS